MGTKKAVWPGWIKKGSSKATTLRLNPEFLQLGIAHLSGRENMLGGGDSTCKGPGV